MNNRPLSMAIIALFLFTSSAQATTNAPATSLDEEKNIQFTFDDKPSVKIAGSSDAAAGMTCSAKSEGAIRYNSTLKSIEFCNGTKWSVMGQSKPELKISCTQLTATGKAPTYFTKVHCPNNTIRLNGGGSCRVASTPSQAVKPPTNVAAVHDSHPNDNGWSVDCYDAKAAVEAVAVAWVECCKITMDGEPVYRDKY